MDDSLETILTDLPGEAMPVDLPARVRARLASVRRGEARARTGLRVATLAVGIVSGVVLWPPFATLADGVLRSVQEAAAPMVSSLVADPGPTLWQLAEGVLAWGPQVSVGLGTTGMIALVAFAAPAFFGLIWTLGGRVEGTPA